MKLIIAFLLNLPAVTLSTCPATWGSDPSLTGCGGCGEVPASCAGSTCADWVSEGVYKYTDYTTVHEVIADVDGPDSGGQCTCACNDTPIAGAPIPVTCTELSDAEITANPLYTGITSCADVGTFGLCDNVVASFIDIEEGAGAAACPCTCAEYESMCFDNDNLMAVVGSSFGLTSCAILLDSSLGTLCTDDSVLAALVPDGMTWIDGLIGKVCCASCLPPPPAVIEVFQDWEISVTVAKDAGAASDAVVVLRELVSAQVVEVLEAEHIHAKAVVKGVSGDGTVVDGGTYVFSVDMLGHVYCDEESCEAIVGMLTVEYVTTVLEGAMAKMVGAGEGVVVSSIEGIVGGGVTISGATVWWDISTETTAPTVAPTMQPTANATVEVTEKNVDVGTIIDTTDGGGGRASLACWGAGLAVAASLFLA